MAIREPMEWNSANTYAMGDRVSYNGIGYQATTAISPTTTDPIGNTDWTVYAIFRATDYYSIQEAVEFYLNSKNPLVIASIPNYIQQVEYTLEKVLRSPAQLAKRVFVVDDESKFLVPDDIIEVLHIRMNMDVSNPYTLRDRGSISIQKGDRTTFEDIRQSYDTTRAYEYQEIWDRPVWWVDDQYLYIAPNYDAGTEIELTYFRREPELGSIGLDVNNAFEPLNAQGQTLAEWIAADPLLNNADNFVQGTTVITSNLWTATVPHLLINGALAQGFRADADADQAAIWDQQFQTMLALTVEEFKKFNKSGEISIQQESQYESDY